MRDRPHAWLNCTGFESVPVRDRPILIGRSRDADFVLPHESVSRKHAIVAFHKGKFRIKNLSPLGLVFNGAEVEGLIDVAVGDLVAIGPFVLRVDDYPVRAHHEDEEEPTLPFGLPQRRTKKDAPPQRRPSSGRPGRPEAPTRGLKRPPGRRPPPGGPARPRQRRPRPE